MLALLDGRKLCMAVDRRKALMRSQALLRSYTEQKALPQVLLGLEWGF